MLKPKKKRGRKSKNAVAAFNDYSEIYLTNEIVKFFTLLNICILP